MHNSSPEKPLGIIKLLAALIVLAGACAFIIHSGREDARYREAMKAIEDSKQTTEAVAQKLREIEQRK